MKKSYKKPELDIMDMYLYDIIAVSGYDDGVEKDIFDDVVVSDSSVSSDK